MVVGKEILDMLPGPELDGQVVQPVLPKLAVSIAPRLQTRFVRSSMCFESLVPPTILLLDLPLPKPDQVRMPTRSQVQHLGHPHPSLVVKSKDA